MSVGVVTSVRDLVVLVQFDEDGPEIGELVIVQNPNHSILLVDHLNTGNIAVCLSVFSDRTIQKNMKADRSGQGIEVPVVLRHLILQLLNIKTSCKNPCIQAPLPWQNPKYCKRELKS
jgi:F0F1-type ATP synthase beta subunit